MLDGCSHLSSLRDLGTRLQDLTRLSIKKCGLTDLDGLNAFPSLQELDISDNSELIDISDLFHHDTLSVLRARRTSLNELTCLEAPADLRGATGGRPCRHTIRDGLHMRTWAHF